MLTHPALRIGALAFVCAFAASAFAEQNSNATTEDLLTGDTRLACEATLCLSSGTQPSECAPSLERYFGINIYDRHGLNWEKTVDARKNFLSLCPGNGEKGMPERVDAISKGAGKCDPDYLNSAYAGTAYRYRSRGSHYDSETGQYYTVYDVQQLPTVTMSTLPAYCVAYNDHAWTYELSVKYVGSPTMGGRWVKAEDYDAAQAKWAAEHGGTWASGWSFSLTDPRRPYDTNR